MTPSSDKFGSLSVLPSSPITLEHDIPRRIEVTDGTLRLVSTAFGQLLNESFTAGVYQARVETSGKPFEQVVFVKPGQASTVTYPVQAREVLQSPAPVPGSQAMHEFLRDPVNQAVLKASTHPSRIIVMATHSAVAQPAIDFSAFRLLDSQGKDCDSITKNSTSGQGGRSKLFATDVAEGGYILEGPTAGFGGDTLVRQPIFCCPGWCTLIFVGARPATGIPDLSTASVYLWRIGSAFAPEQTTPEKVLSDPILESQRYTELALHSLVSGRTLLSMAQVSMSLLNQKFQNPMLGVLGCHLLLQQASKDDNLVQIVLANLATLIPGHPDVEALKVMARRSSIKVDGAVSPITWPPMLLAGLRALRDADWAKPGTILPDSLFDRIRARVVSGGAWTRWIAGKTSEEFSSALKLKGAVKSDPATRAGVVSTVLREILTFAKLLDLKKIQPDDFVSSGMSRRQATAAASTVNMRLRGPSKIAYKKAAAKKAVKNPSSTKSAVKSGGRARRPDATRTVAKGRPSKGPMKARAKRR